MPQPVSNAMEIYDLRGLNCPLPVLKTRRKLQDMPSGSVLRVETTDPMSRIDMPHFCSQEGHDLLESSIEGAIYAFIIRKNNGV